jgi:hypothetical protein
MSRRSEIIEELFRSNLITDYSDLSIVASALDYGLAADYILHSALVGRWPGLSAWLRERLKEDLTDGDLPDDLC